MSSPTPKTSTSRGGVYRVPELTMDLAGAGSATSLEEDGDCSHSFTGSSAVADANEHS
jgi:hypothetical protein